MPETEQGPGYGGAILAAVADGKYESVEAACEKLVSIKARIEPEPELAARYEERYQAFRKLYPALKDAFKAL